MFVAMGGKVIFVLPCMCHSWLSIETKQGGMKMTLPPMARCLLERQSDWIPRRARSWRGRRR
jgi:hypothetical protein